MTTTVTENQAQLATDSSRPIRTSQYPKPLTPYGALERFSHFDVTPFIGREYKNVNIVNDLLNGKDANELLHDLALTISQRGVVFFRAQDNLTDDLQKVFVQRLGELSGKPADSTLHIHPIHNGTNEHGVDDDEISTISSRAFKAFTASVLTATDRDDNKRGAASWHSDIQFESFPADYTSLRLTELPENGGGDTLWASGYELYDRFSDAYRTFFEGLTATFVGEGFLKGVAAQPDRFKLHEGPRGNPENIGRELSAVHPVVRTNPVTGWKSIFAVGNFPQRINELSAKESKEVLDLLRTRIEQNHDLTVRFRWSNKNDIAIWDNRSFFHSATNDYTGERTGHRAVGIGERPYLDKNSQSRTAALRSG